MRPPRRLRSQITLSAALLVALVVALSGLVIALRIDNQDRDQLDDQLRARLARIELDSDKPGDNGALFNDVNQAGASGSDSNILVDPDSVTRVFSDGELVAERGDGFSSSVSVPVESGFSTVTINGEHWRSLVGPTEIVPKGQVQVLQSLAPVEERLDDSRRLIAIVAAVATILTGVAAWLITGLVLRPLERLRKSAQSVAPGAGSDLRLTPVDHPQEVAELSATLNAMLERLERSMQATRRFTADAGHELRTPLTALGADLETLRRDPDLPESARKEMLDAMTREHQRIVTLLDGLQHLARGDAEALPDSAPFEVDEIVRVAVRSARGRHRSVNYRLAATAPAAGSGWADGLRLAVDNLLDNAALHGNADGDVEVSVTTDDGGVRIAVTDDGPGIDPAHRGRLRERFARGDNSRGKGSGLGLALVDQQARLHGGKLDLDDARHGGLQATISLPIARER